MAEMFVNPTDDTYIENRQPGENFGSLIILYTVHDTSINLIQDTYLKFEVPDVDIDFVYLRLYVTPDTGVNPGRITLFDSPNVVWNESEPTWNNPLEIGTELMLDVDFTSARGYWTNINITDFIKAKRGETVTIIAIAVDTPFWLGFGSKESGEKPNLRIIYTEAPPDQAIVHFTSEPSGATILYKGNDFGWKTPYTDKKDVRYFATIHYQLEGYETISFQADVAVGQEITYHRVLTPIEVPPETGGVVGVANDIDTGYSIEGVLVTLNGCETLTLIDGGYSIQNIPVGDYAMVFSKDGYESGVKYVTILKDVSATIDVLMTPEYPFPILGWLAQLKTFALETLPGWILSIPRVIADTLDNVYNIMTILSTTIPNALQKAKDYAKSLVDAVVTIIPQWIIDAANSVLNWWNDMVSYVGGQIQNAKDYAYNLVQNIEFIVPQWIMDIVESVRTWWADVTSYVTGKIEDFKVWVASAISDAIDWVVKTAADSWNWITATGTDLHNWFSDTAKDAVNWVNDAGIALFNEFHEFKAKIIEHVENAIFYILDKSIEKKEDIREEFRKGMP